MKVTIGKDIDLDQEVVVLKRGRYTEADARADAEAAERASAPGRPSLGEGVSPQVSFRVPRSVKDDLTRVADAVGETEAAVARRALIEFLERRVSL